MIKYILIFLIAISSLQLFAAGDTLRPSFLLGASYGINFHPSNIQSPITCCAKDFDFVSGKGFNFQVGYSYPTPNSKINSSIDMFIEFQNLGGDFSKNTIEPIAFNNTSIDGTIQNRMKANISVLNLKALYSINLINNFFLKVGPNVGYIMTATGDGIEEIIAPNDRGFFKENGKRTRNELTGTDLKSQSLRVALDFGLSYQSLPLNKERTLLAQPFVNYSLALTSMQTEFTWRANQLAFGLNVAYSPIESIKINREIQQIDTLKIISDVLDKAELIAGIQTIKERSYESKDTIINEKTIVRTDTLYYPNPNKPKLEKEREELIASLKVIGYEGDKELGEVKDVKLKVELSREIYPLLPYIFFDEKQSTLPQRYVQIGNLKDFSPTDLDPSPTVYHRNILKILASRMLENPDAKISLTGYVDPTTEADMCDLAYARASQVKQLLVDRFGIAENRITLNKETTCYPKDLTRSATIEGYAENRRVDIGTNKPEVLFAVANARYQNPTLIVPTKIVAEPFSVINRIKGDDVKIFPPANWQLEVYQDKTNFLSHQSVSEVVAMPIAITRNNAKLLNNVSPLTINFTAYDNQGQTKVIKKEIRVQKDTSLIEIESLTLTVFQVSQYTLDNRIKNEIRKFISKLDANSTISIRGYSDNLGNAENNKSLSQVRANEVRDFIKQTAPSAKIIEVVGFGSDKFAPGVTSYASPEERFISRTVEIEIKKTLEK